MVGLNNYYYVISTMKKLNEDCNGELYNLIFENILFLNITQAL